MAEMTPMMRQYMEIKEQNKDSILFFRLGDFYETTPGRRPVSWI